MSQILFLIYIILILKSGHFYFFTKLADKSNFKNPTNQIVEQKLYSQNPHEEAGERGICLFFYPPPPVSMDLEQNRPASTKRNNNNKDHKQGNRHHHEHPFYFVKKVFFVSLPDTDDAYFMTSLYNYLMSGIVISFRVNGPNPAHYQVMCGNGRRMRSDLAVPEYPDGSVFEFRDDACDFYDNIYILFNHRNCLDTSLLEPVSGNDYYNNVLQFVPHGGGQSSPPTVIDFPQGSLGEDRIRKIYNYISRRFSIQFRISR